MQMTARGVWEFISTTIVAAAAITMLLLYVHDRRQPGPASGSAQVFVDDWEEWDDSAIRMGPEGATLVIASFMDFTCPFCRNLVPVFDSLRAEFGREVAVDFHHFPLYGHRFAGPAAAAADCAHRQGRFAEMYHTLFSQVDSFGSKTWGPLPPMQVFRISPALRSASRSLLRPSPGSPPGGP